jgi:hypothetical protein
MNLNHLIELDDYLTNAANELIINATDACYDDDIALTDLNIARSISADQLESACFTNLRFLAPFAIDYRDTFLLHALLESILARRLRTTPDQICADY